MMSMKTSVLRICIVFICLFLFFGCSRSDLTPTGYPDGQLQTKLLYYHDTLYTTSYNWKTESSLPPTSCEIGSILIVDDYNIPQTDFSAAHINIGDRIFVKDTDDYSELYVLTDDYENMLEVFIPFEE